MKFSGCIQSFCVIILLVSVAELQRTASDADNIVVVVLSQSNVYHVQRAELFRQDIFDQAKALHLTAPRIYLLHEEWPKPGAWTILPIIASLVVKLSDKRSAVVFCHEDVRLNLDKFLSNLNNYNLSKELFIGRALHDQEPTVIHHFAFHEDPSSFAYPDFTSCFLISFPLLHSLSERLTSVRPTTDFSIDAAHELSLFMWNNGVGVTLTDADFLCGYQRSDAINSSCSVWLSSNFPHCGEAVSDDVLLVAVKTCHKYHHDRVDVIKKTWERDAKHIIYFSDVADDSVPTVTLGIPNTERGHCAKLLAILHYMYNQSQVNSFKWFFVVDDDTLVSLPRLRRLMSCYSPSEPVALGERYGYALQRNSGYNYITLGGGMVISVAMLQQLVTSDTCHCSAADAPDDMTLGLCLKHLDIDITHSPLFHQARPADYAERYLSNHLAVTFHRHWMIDPVDVYHQWLVDKPPANHQEL